MTIDYPTRLTVDPSTFRGGLTCGAPGLQDYVVTLNNVTEGAPKEKTMTSSGPVACQNFVSFGDTFVLSSNFYTATIEGYDRDVVAMGGDLPNLVKPTMIDPSTGEEILPKWTTTCGEVPPYIPEAGPGDELDAGADAPPPYNALRFPTRALGKSEVIMHGCLPLAASSPVDASTGDGSSGGEDASADGEVPGDAGADAVDASRSDVTEPDGTFPTDGGGAEEGGEEGGTDAEGADAGGSEAGGNDDGGADAVAAAITAAKRRGSR